MDNQVSQIETLNIPKKYQKDIETAVEILKKEGCQSVYLFGSMVTGYIHEHSDIDIGIMGLPKGKFFGTCGKVDFAIENDIDIVDFDFNNSLFILLKRLGEVIQIG